MSDALFVLPAESEAHPAAERVEVPGAARMVGAGADGVLPAVGDRFVFHGLVGQDGDPGQRLPGSGAVGWVGEVAGISPWGSLSILMGATVEDLSPGHVVSVGLFDVVTMLRAGVWARIDS